MGRRVEHETDDEGTASRDGFPIDPRRMLRVVLRGRKTVAIAVAVGVVLGALVAKFGVARSYLTSATVRYDGLAGQSFLEAQQEVSSLASVGQTDRFVRAIRDRARLGDVSLDAMRAMLQVSADPGTRQVSFVAYGETPEKAAALANDAAAIFLEHHRELREASLRSEQASVAERIRATSAELHDARAAYDTFRQEHGITELSLEQSQVIEQAAELRTQATMAAAEVEAARSRVQRLREAMADAPRTRAAPGSEATRRLEDARLVELRQRLREARGQGLGEAHPQVQSLQRQVAGLERQAGEGESAGSGAEARGGGGGLAVGARALETAEAELGSLESRRAALEQLAAAAAERSDRVGSIESQAASLLAQVNVKGEQVESLTQRAAAIDDQLHDVPTGFRVVSNALAPETAVPSKKKKIVALAVPLVFGLVALIVLVARDLRGMRLIAPTELAFWGAAPVVATSAWPRDAAAFDELLADLEEVMRERRGELLIVGATPIERGLAETLVLAIRENWRGVLREEQERDARGAVAIAQVAGANEAFASGNVLPLGRRGRMPAPFGSGTPNPDETGGVRVRHALRVTSFVPDGPHGMVALRRAARRADGVLVLVGAGVDLRLLRSFRAALARESGVGFALLAVSDDVVRQNDREGELDAFLEGFAGGA